MLFGKRKRIVKRILIVEDEPLIAFDNENMLGDAGYEVVATLDDFDDAIETSSREASILILSDVRLSDSSKPESSSRAMRRQRVCRPCSRPDSRIRARRESPSDAS